MSALVLKIIAIVTMLLDHIGAMTGEHMLRVVGRLSLPIFAFLIANGFRHTRRVKKYILRLLAFAVISEVPFDLFVSNKISIIKYNGLIPDFKFDNILFTLLIGLVYIYLSDLYKKKGFKFTKLLSAATFIVLGSLAGFISADYGAAGVAWVALFGSFDVQKKENAAPLALGSVVLASWHVILKNFAKGIFQITGMSIDKVPIVFYFFSGADVSAFDRMQMVSAISIILILLYNGKSGMPKSPVAKNILKYAFYIFYPAHLLVLYFIAYNLV